MKQEIKLELSKPARKKIKMIAKDLQANIMWSDIRRMHNVNDTIIRGVKDYIESYSHDYGKFISDVKRNKLKPMNKPLTVGHTR